MIKFGSNDKAAPVASVKIGDASGKAANVVGGWIGDENGKARTVWSGGGEPFVFTCKTGVNLHVSGSNLRIDFGDGTTQNIGKSGDISHLYADSNNHQVKLYGTLSAIRFWDDDGEDAKGYLQSIDSPFPGKNRILTFYFTFNKCTSLTSIPSGLFDNCTAVENFDSTFDSCTSLTSIPAGLFDNCTAVKSFGSTFTNCTSLTSIPSGLFDNCTAVTRFNSAFWNCTSLTSIPAGLFDNCPNVTNFGYTFLKCTAITSAVPKLWDTAKWPNVTDHEGCFHNCTSAANYADIPAGWK